VVHRSLSGKHLRSMVSTVSTD